MKKIIVRLGFAALDAARPGDMLIGMTTREEVG